MKTGLDSKSAQSVADFAQTPAFRDSLLWFVKEKQWINDRHLQICRIPAPTFLEQKRAEWMASQLRALGLETEIDRAGNVVARFGSDTRQPLVAVTAHLDTVLAPRRPEDISVAPDGRLHGPGVSDNGAGLAALLAFARVLKESPVLEDAEAGLVLVANVGEEGEGNLSGMRYLCRQSPIAPRIRACIVLDGPATDHITCQALASRRFEVAFSGPGGHSWSDYGIGNPVHALSQAISLFSQNWTENGSNSGPRSSFNFGTFEGGSSINSIPAAARAKVDFRSESNRRIEDFAKELANAVEQALERENQRATGGKLTAKIRELGSRPSGQLQPDSALLGWLRAVDTHLGIKARIDCASTDANVPLSMGLEAVAIGAGGQGGGAHTAAEWYSPEGRDLGLKRILLTLAMFAHDAASVRMGG